jgi:hypothetical protein
MPEVAPRIASATTYPLVFKLWVRPVLQMSLPTKGLQVGKREIFLDKFSLLNFKTNF